MMKMRGRNAVRKAEQGVALVIAIFTMMLISVVATALILMSGTASAIKANYKNSMEAFYDAKAGLEEGRSRLFWDQAVKNCVGALPMPAGQVCYVTNPDAAAGESSIDPTNTSDPFYDSEYNNEFGVGSLAGANVNQVASNSPSSSPSLAGPLYKWVRITARTGKSAGVNANGSAGSDINPLFYCVPTVPSSSSNCPDTLPHEWPFSGGGTPPDGSTQVLEITALAVTPGGGVSGRRLLQYTVAENPNLLGQVLTSNGASPALNQILPGALTLDGNEVSFVTGAPVNGNDGSASAGSNAGEAAIVYTNSGDTAPSCSCQSPTGVQSVQNLALPNLMQNPSGLDALVQAVTQDAAVVITPAAGTTADQTSLPSNMSATNPMIVVVNGNFSLSHAGATSFTGYGLLLVTGNFYYDPDDTWNGIIMVIGNGVFDGSKHGHGGEINGAVIVANTRDRSSGNLLASLGPASVNLSGGGNGIHYNSANVNSLSSMAPYQVLSFREVPLTQ